MGLSKAGLLLGSLAAGLLAATGGAAPSGIRSARGPAAAESHPPSPAPSVNPVALHFEENRGQADASVRFLARGRGFRAFFTDAESVFVVPGDGAPDAVRMRFVGSRESAPRAEGPLPGRSHYFLGREPGGWITGVPHFRGIGTEDLYPGVRLRWRGLPDGRLEWDLLLAPRAQAGAVLLRFEGASSVRVEPGGDLLVGTRRGFLRHRKPEAWQEVGGNRRPVAAGFALDGEGRVSLRLGPRDGDLPLVVDPVVQYETFLGGAAADHGNAVAADPAGGAVVAGRTYSLNFPTAGAVQPVHGLDSGSGDAQDSFVSRFSPAGDSLVYSTYLGGTDFDMARCVAVDSTGAAYVAGATRSGDFPVRNPYQAIKGASYETGFLAKLAPNGSSLTYSTYIGGTNTDDVFGVAVDAAGSAYLTGSTRSTNFPTKDPFQASHAGGVVDSFVAKINPAGSALVWSSFLGGTGNDYCQSIALSPDDAVVVAGYTDSTNFPVSSPFQAARKGGQDAFLAKITNDGSTKVYSTYLGGSSDDMAYGVAVDRSGVAWVTGSTVSSDFPTAGGFGPGNSGGGEAFLTTVSVSGALADSCYFGGSGADSGAAIAIDAGGAACITGTTSSTNFPVANPIQAAIGGATDAFVTNVRPGVNGMAWSTYLGGSGADSGRGVASGANGRILVVGTTSSTNFPTASPLQPGIGVVPDAFVASILGDLYAPGDPTAILVGLTAIQVRWVDTSGTETGYKVERASGGGPFTLQATLPANATVFDDAGLAPDTTYTYRMMAFHATATSAPSDEVSATTPPTPVSPPAAPSLLQVIAVSPREADLSWQDNSDNEDFFVVARATGTGLFATRATPSLGVTAFKDDSVVPEVTYSWKVKAQNPVGSSIFFSNTVTLTMPSTLDVLVSKGRISDKDDIRKDALSLAGTFGYSPGALAGEFDPATQSLALRLGDMGSPPIFDIPAGDTGWRLKKGKHTWKSPRGALGTVKVVVTPATGAWTAKVGRITLPAPVTAPPRVTLSAGTDTGHFEAPWTPPTKGGVVKYPVPVPK